MPPPLGLAFGFFFAGAAACQLSWQGPGIDLQPIPSSALDSDEPWRRELESGLNANLTMPAGAKRSLPIDTSEGALSVQVDTGR